MKLTNKLNLPRVFFNYYENEKHEFNPNKYSVTELLGSVQEIRLAREHRDEIEKDISDLIPALFGTAVHSVLEKNAPEDVKTEVKLEAQIDSTTIVGRCDVLNEKEKLIEDYKTCSVNKIMKQDFEDWRLQGLIYAWICCYFYNIEIRHLKFYALMKDWSKLKASYGGSYPNSPIYVWEYDVKDSDYDYINKWIKDKLDQIRNSDNVKCSDEEKWYTGTKWAVYKKETDIKAVKVFDNWETAEEFCKQFSEGKIECRPGENLKCLYYCDCKKFCKQYKEESNGEKC